MKDYEAKVRSATDQAKFYVKILDDMNIDGIVDRLVMQGREEVRSIVGYRIEWPKFAELSLSYRFGKYVSGEDTLRHGEMTYSFQQITIPPEFYEEFLLLGGQEMDADYVYKIYEHLVKDGNSHVKFRWRLRCALSSEDKSLLRSIGVIKHIPGYNYQHPSRDSVSCGAHSDEIPV